MIIRLYRIEFIIKKYKIDSTNFENTGRYLQKKDVKKLRRGVISKTCCFNDKQLIKRTRENLETMLIKRTQLISKGHARNKKLTNKNLETRLNYGKEFYLLLVLVR